MKVDSLPAEPQRKPLTDKTLWQTDFSGENCFTKYLVNQNTDEEDFLTCSNKIQMFSY